MPGQAAIIGAEKPALAPRVDALGRIGRIGWSQGLNPRQRRRNVAGAFRVADKARAAVAGRCIILVDDVLTIGVIAHACTCMLKRAGAASIRLLTLARVVQAADAGHIAS